MGEGKAMAPMRGFRIRRNGVVGRGGREKLEIFMLWHEEPNFGKAFRNSNSYPEQNRNEISFILQKTPKRVHLPECYQGSFF